MARFTESACRLPPDSVFVMSTGVIGHKMPLEKVKHGINLAAEAIWGEAGAQGFQATEAIMTTDLKRKTAAVEFKVGRRPVVLAAE